MVRGEGENIRVHYTGKDEDFIIFVDSPEAVNEWKADKTKDVNTFVPLLKIFVNDKQGAQGQLRAASKAVLENQFSTSKDEEVIKRILEDGNVQASQFPDRQGATNDSKGGSTFGTGNKPF